MNFWCHMFVNFVYMLTKVVMRREQKVRWAKQQDIQ